jgi:hypothetical protein
VAVAHVLKDGMPPSIDARLQVISRLRTNGTG